MGSHTREGTTIRDAALPDAAGIAAIYNHYVAETVVTFEEEPVSADEMAQRMEDVWSATLPWLVAEEANRIVGYAYATKWMRRSAYRYSAETTVYLAPEEGGRGIGSNLYAQLIPTPQARKIHAIVAGIALPNEASVALHQKFGMRKVAHFQEVGFKLARWIDVGYWERLL